MNLRPTTARSRLIMGVTLLILTAGCAGTKDLRLSPALPIEAAMAKVGKLAELQTPDEKSRGQVIVIKDRHSTKPGLHRVRPQLRQVHRDHRLLVDYLVATGHHLLGCEFPLGPIKRGPDTERQYALIEERLARPSSLDEYGLFQPVRYQLVHGEELRVMGVEDPEIFARDRQLFQSFLALDRKRRLAATPKKERRLIKLRMAVLANRIKGNSDLRGEAAALNLIDAMEDSGLERAILILGGAHVPAATQTFTELGYEVRIFESSRYAAEERKATRRR